MLLPSLDYASHPFYRIPPREAGVKLPPFDGFAALTTSEEGAYRAVRKLSDNLLAHRKILSNQVLDIKDLEALMDIVRGLLSYTSSWRPDKFSSERKASRLVEPLARQLIVVDAIFTACEAVGTVMNRSAWWGTLMGRIIKPVAFLAGPSRIAVDDKRPLVEQILAMLEIYRSGRRPEPQALVEVKQKIFQKPCAHPAYRRPKWDPWREDDKRFWDRRQKRAAAEVGA